MNEEQVRALKDDALIEAYRATLAKAKADNAAAWDSAVELGEIAIEMNRRGLSSK